MTDLAKFADLAARDRGFALVTLARPDGTAHASLVCAGVLPHPLTGDKVVGVAAGGGTRKLTYLRANPHVTVVARVGGQWAAVEGRAELAGPDDPLDGVSAERLRLLLREIFTAAGGTHENFDAYDQAMVAERRTAMLITPTRTYAH